MMRVRSPLMTKHVRAIGIAAVFLVGCAVGGASARFVVPPANAQQHAGGFTTWEYFCFETDDLDDVGPKANQAGREGWELAAAGPNASMGNTTQIWCFKRPMVR